MKRFIRLVPALLGLGVVLAACGAQPVPAALPSAEGAATPPTTDVAAVTEAPASTASAPEAPIASPATEAAPADWLNTVTMQGDYYVLGNPAASVRLIDFSDFL